MSIDPLATSIRLAVCSPQQPLLAIEVEVSAAIPTQAPLDRGAVLQNIQQHDHRQGQKDKREVGMIGPKVADLEEDVLESADGRLGSQLGRRCNDPGQRFENRRSRWHDVGAGIRDIPVSTVLSILAPPTNR